MLGMRDIINHHYSDVGAEAIFDVYQNHIGKQGKTISKISKEIQN